MGSEIDYCLMMIHTTTRLPLPHPFTTHHSDAIKSPIGFSIPMNLCSRT